MRSLTPLSHPLSLSKSYPLRSGTPFLPPLSPAAHSLLQSVHLLETTKPQSQPDSQVSFSPSREEEDVPPRRRKRRPSYHCLRVLHLLHALPRPSCRQSMDSRFLGYYGFESGYFNFCSFFFFFLLGRNQFGF